MQQPILLPLSHIIAVIQIGITPVLLQQTTPVGLAQKHPSQSTTLVQ